MQPYRIMDPLSLTDPTRESISPTGGTKRVSRFQPKADAGANYLFRFEAVRPWMTGRTVLDIGAARSFRTLHTLIKGVAAEVLAVDLDRAAVEAMTDAGYEAIVGDAQALELHRRFDVVFGGELIEHLDNYRGFFDSVRAHLNPGGHLVLTTPNAFRFMNFFYRLGRGTPPVNDDHMVWFCETTLRQLLDRQGFDLVELGYVKHRTPGTVRRLIAGAIRASLPSRLAESTIVAVAQPRSGGEHRDPL